MEEELIRQTLERIPVAKVAVPICLCFFGVLAFVIALIFLIVRLIKKKNLKAAVIVLIASSAAIICGLVLAQSAAPLFADTYSEVLIEKKLADFSGSVDSLSFSTTDKDGNKIDSSVFAGSKVTLVNRWEPWCNPCKAEMPDIEALYQKYKDKGFNVIGVYSDEEDLTDALQLTGVTYPIIRKSDDFSYFGLCGSVPSSVFVDSEGNYLTIPEEYRSSTLFGDLIVIVSEDYDSKVLVGARDADAWEDMILRFLE